MLTKRIIPCLDVKEGRVVKGIQFLNLVDAGDPVELARFYDSEGADELVFLDISASHEGRETMVEVVERVAAELAIPFTVGGGINKLEDMKRVLRAGADKVSVNTAAVLRPELITEGSDYFGAQCIVVAIDAKYDEELGSWRVYTHGGRKPTQWEVTEWAKEAVNRGAGEILLTSMDQDGEKSGFNLELTKAVSEAVTVPVIASGGAGSSKHFYDAFRDGKADAGLAASIFHYKETSIAEVKTELRKLGGVCTMNLEKLNFDEKGLIPAIVQDYQSKEVLTVAYMNRESLEKTIEIGETVFFSRSRQELWHKGETSGNTQKVKSIRYDCDQDAVVVLVEPQGPACHTGSYSCFSETLYSADDKADAPNADRYAILTELQEVIAKREHEMPEGAYTTYLFEHGVDKILKKVGEEAGEVIIAAKNRDPEELKWEVSDLLYHVLVLLQEQKVPLDEILTTLKERHTKKDN